MANFASKHSGLEIDEAVDKALETEIVNAKEKDSWNSKADGNHNHDTIYAARVHNHDTLYTTIEHSANNDIHVTTDDKNNWDSKANGSHNHSAGNITSGTLGVARGGTGRGTLTANSFLRGNGTGAVALSTPSQVLGDIGAATSGHTHTPASLGAAPDGYGLGASVSPYAADANLLGANGFYRVNADTIGGFGSVGLILHQQFDGAYAVQRGHTPGGTNPIRFKQDGVWQPWNISELKITDREGAGICNRPGSYLLFAESYSSYYFGAVYKAAGQQPEISCISSNNMTVKDTNTAGTIVMYNTTAPGVAVDINMMSLWIGGIS